MRFLSIVVISFLVPLSSIASDEWVCTEVASQRLENEIKSCGIGIDAAEADARLKAFDSAKTEFDRVCNASDDCRGHEVQVDPKRTSCATEGNKFKCYRMIAFTVKSTMKAAASSSSTSLAGPSRDTQVSKSQQVVSFKEPVPQGPFDNGGKPKLRRGLKKSQVVAMFGKPESVVQLMFNTEAFYYGESEYCPNFCAVDFEKGRVSSWSDIKPEFTTDLDDAAETATTHVDRSKTEAAKKLRKEFIPRPGHIAGRFTPPAGTIPLFDISSKVPILGDMPHAFVQQAIVSRDYSFPKGVEVHVFNPEKELGTISSEEASEAFRSGYVYATPADIKAASAR